MTVIRLCLTFAVLGGLLAVRTQNRASAADHPRLEVVNGDFSDLSSLTAGNDGWYAGLPKGWRGSKG
ncbi:MAG: hypothetical protein HUU20_04215 [Pirellulales bacterium]|nr:hypothetical protein [Pirellulales bacterium]